MVSKPYGESQKYKALAGIRQDFLSTLKSISKSQKQAEPTNTSEKNKMPSSDAADGHSAISQMLTSCLGDLDNMLTFKTPAQSESSGIYSGQVAASQKLEVLNLLEAFEIRLLLKHPNDTSSPNAAENRPETNTDAQFVQRAELVKLLDHSQKEGGMVPSSGIAAGNGLETNDNIQVDQTAELDKFLRHLHTKGEKIASSVIRNLVDLSNYLDAEGNPVKTDDASIEKLVHNLIAKSEAPNIERESQNATYSIPADNALNAGKANLGDILKEFSASLVLQNSQTQSFTQVDEKTASNLNADHLEINLFDKGQFETRTETVNSYESLKTGYLLKGMAQNSTLQNLQQQEAVQSTRKTEGVENPDRMNLSLKSGTGTDDTSQNSSKDEPAAKNSGQSLNIQTTNFKTEFSMNEGIGSKGLKSDSGNKDGSSLFASHQTEVLTSECRIPTKDAEMAQKELPVRILDQLVQKAVLHLRTGQSEVKIDLKPDFMGQIRVQIITENQQITVRILTEFPFVKDLIENNFHQLKLELQNQGLKVDELEVSVADESDKQSGDHQKTVATKMQNSADNGQPKENSQSDKMTTAQPKTGSSRNETIIDYFA